MDLKNLKQHIKTLATLEENDDPVISCYLNVEKGLHNSQSYMEQRIQWIEKSIFGSQKHSFEEALKVIDNRLKNVDLSQVKGLAFFTRGGKSPFSLELRFRVPLPNEFIVETTPSIYRLVELKDTYYRYVFVLSTEESGRIFEVNYGEVTESVWVERPELRKRIGREWTKEHYQNHRKNRTEKFVKEKVKILENIVNSGGYTHIVLVGNAKMTARIKNELPPHLQEKVIDALKVSEKEKLNAIVAETLNAFVNQEQQESLEAVELLQKKIYTDGLAVVGIPACLKALQKGQADMLVLAKEFKEEDKREELVKLATQTGCKVELVEDSYRLMQYDGVGCLLRYRSPETY